MCIDKHSAFKISLFVADFINLANFIITAFLHFTSMTCEFIIPLIISSIILGMRIHFILHQHCQYFHFDTLSEKQHDYIYLITSAVYYFLISLYVIIANLILGSISFWAVLYIFIKMNILTLIVLVPIIIEESWK